MRKFFRLFRDNRRLPAIALVISIIVLIPRWVGIFVSGLSFEQDIPYLADILSNEIYQRCADYAHILLIIAICVLIIMTIYKHISSKLRSLFSRFTSDFFRAQANAEVEMNKENDLKLKEKAIESKQSTPHVVKCPICGKSNSIVGTVGKCKACRNPIEYKGKF